MSTQQINPKTDTSTASDALVADSPDLFLNRELQWLQFNRRVLHEAIDPRTPLLQRARFLSIFTSNLDEFFMKRVGGLKRQVAAGVGPSWAGGMHPSEQLSAIRDTVRPMLVEQADCFKNLIHPALADADIFLLNWSQLTEGDREFACSYFRSGVFPVLTPLAVDPGHPFPFISNLSLSLGVALKHVNTDEQLFARVKVPPTLPQWVRLDDASLQTEPRVYRFLSLVELIEHNLEMLFPHMQVLSTMPFVITRNADIEHDEEDADDLLAMIEQELRDRRFENVVRLEHSPKPDPWMYELLINELEVTENDVYEMPAKINFLSLDQIADLNIPQHHYKTWTPTVPAALADEDTDIFSTIRSGDLLVHHPYESFSASVERFISAAADDPKVLAIKMTVYRTGDDSPFVRTLIRAAENGKQVVCLVELKARFDEERNVQLAQALEKAGVHVGYGLVGYKTHTKTALVVRREGDNLRSYAHIGTGNYHIGTAKLYTDLGLLTCEPAFTEDLTQMFNYLTGRSLMKDYEKLLVAPVNMEDRFFELIRQEIAHSQAGRPAHLIAKVNSLEHRGLCRELYRASAAGVQIDLIVRGFCCLRPGIAGLSENIRVISVVGRFLEHSRLFYFRDGAEDPLGGHFFIGSADWMYRNLRHRIEVLTPIEDRPLREKCWGILQCMLDDQRQVWDMHSDGHYTQRIPTDPQQQCGTHQQMIELYSQRQA